VLLEINSESYTDLDHESLDLYQFYNYKAVNNPSDYYLIGINHP